MFHISRTMMFDSRRFSHCNFTVNFFSRPWLITATPAYFSRSIKPVMSAHSETSLKKKTLKLRYATFSIFPSPQTSFPTRSDFDSLTDEKSTTKETRRNAPKITSFPFLLSTSPTFTEFAGKYGDSACVLRERRFHFANSDETFARD